MAPVKIHALDATRLCQLFLLLFMAVQNAQGVAADQKSLAHIVRFAEETPVTELHWLSRNPVVRIVQLNGTRQAVTDLQGTFLKAGWGLFVQDLRVKMDARGAFTVTVPVTNKTAYFDVTAKPDVAGKSAAHEKIGVIFDNWQEYSKKEKLAPVVAPTVRALASVEPAKVETATVPKPPDEYKAGFRLSLIPNYSTVSLNAVDATSNDNNVVSSMLGLGADVKLKFDASPQFHPYLLVRGNYRSFSASSALALNTSSYSQFGAGVGTEIFPFENTRFSLNGIFAYEQQLFLRETSSTSITLDSVGVPAFQLEVAYKFISTNNFDLGLSAGGTFYVAGTSLLQTTSPGYEYLGRVFANKHFATRDGFVAFEYQHRSLNSLTVTQTFSVFLLEAGLEFFL